jgi:hypothetical protein
VDGAQGPQGEQDPQGEPGATGETGAQGPAGAAGADGTSVIVASEPAGDNCASGGAKFTDGQNNVA